MSGARRKERARVAEPKLSARDEASTFRMTLDDEQNRRVDFVMKYCAERVRKIDTLARHHVKKATPNTARNNPRDRMDCGLHHAKRLRDITEKSY